ncbi:MAG: 4-(cytidine 5'-diphospho)-2-C-methyl-D-erythritol kinase [Clostridia bacterium]|nr:4-(cytidine 5'-diphospho)-2-C-methyl-D-erythritol kinase [Clostridia bacterium]
MRSELTILAPAKINIFLEILDKRGDGYHNLDSVMQTVSLCDVLRVRRGQYAGQNSISLSTNGNALDVAPEKNLVYLAAKAFFDHAGIDKYNVSFTLTKRIPLQAGLGGGSSDAAATLIALDELYETGMTVGKLCEIAIGIGSDVPFCVRRGTCRVQGKGEFVSDVTPFPDCVFLIALPQGEKISTAQAYSLADEINMGDRVSPDGILSAMNECDIGLICENVYNRFEATVTSDSAVTKIKEMMMGNGAFASIMSGSGPSVVGFFADVPTAKCAADAVAGLADVYVCSPMRRDANYYRD